MGIYIDRGLAYLIPCRKLDGYKSLCVGGTSYVVVIGTGEVDDRLVALSLYDPKTWLSQNVGEVAVKLDTQPPDLVLTQEEQERIVCAEAMAKAQGAWYDVTQLSFTY